MRLAIVLAAAACSGPTSTVCGDGTFCPPSTVCGPEQSCLVEQGACVGEFELYPCIGEGFDIGHCRAAECDAPVEIIGFGVSFPGDVGLPGLRVTAPEHPEVLPSISNVNGYFGALVPRNTDVILELEYPDSMIARTRVIHAGDDSVPADAIYGGIPIISFALVDDVQRMLGMARIPGTGIVTGSVQDEVAGVPLEDVAAMLTGRDCIGPIYFTMNGTATLEAPGTLDAGIYAFANCTPGPAELTLSHPARTCQPSDLPSTTIPVEVVADRLLFVGRAFCN